MPIDAARIAVMGVSGAGKSTLARTLALALGHSHIELDRVAWHTRGRRGAFRRRVQVLLSGPCWVCDGNYRFLDDLVLARATQVAWLDVRPHTAALAQLVRAMRGIPPDEPWRPSWRELVRPRSFVLTQSLSAVRRTRAVLRPHLRAGRITRWPSSRAAQRDLLASIATPTAPAGHAPDNHCFTTGVRV